MTPEQLKELVLAAPILATSAKQYVVGEEVKEIFLAQLQPGNTPCSKVFAVYVKADYELTARLFVTNTGARSYLRYLRTLTNEQQPQNIEEWGWANLELTQAFRNKAAF